MEENLIYKIKLFELIESYYNIEIRDEEIETIFTFEDLINLIKVKISNGNVAQPGRAFG